MFKIEVQADSIPQLADRLLALGAQLSIPPTEGLARVIAHVDTFARDADPQVPISATATAEPTPKRTRGPNKPKPEPEVEAAQAEAEAPQTESMVETVEAEVVEPESGTVAADLDFDKDVAPRVLDLVARKGREAMTAILDEFGAARASEVDQAQWPELVAKLEEAVA